MTKQPDPTEYLCPNCVTPWKCNGPHIPDPTTVHDDLARLHAIEYEARQWHDAIRRGDFGPSTCACNRANGTRCTLGTALESKP